MPKLSLVQIKKLMDNSIDVSPAFRENHAYSSGHALMPRDENSPVLPESVVATPDSENVTYEDKIFVYGGPHFLRIYGVGDKWYIECHHFVPGPGPGDFLNEWNSADEAVDDAIKYFAGDERYQLKERIERYYNYNFKDEHFERVRGAGLRCRRLAGIDGYRIAKTDFGVEKPTQKDEVEKGYEARVFTDESNWFTEFKPIPPLQTEIKTTKWSCVEEAIDDAIDFFSNREGKGF